MPYDRPIPKIEAKNSNHKIKELLIFLHPGSATVLSDCSNTNGKI